MWYRFVTLWLVVVALSAACGDGTSDTSESGTAAQTDTAPSEPTVGPDGGVVMSLDGVLKVEVPAGALSESVPIAIEAASATDLGLDESVAAGTAYQITPDGTEFSVPVGITMTLSAADLGVTGDGVPFIHIFHGEDDGWVPLSTETTRDGDEVAVAASVSHFSSIIAFAPADFWGPDGRPPSSFDPDLVLRPGTATVLVRGSFVASWWLWTKEWANTFEADPSTDIANLAVSGAVASFELDDDAGTVTGTGTVTCGDAEGAGEYVVTVDGTIFTGGQVAKGFFETLGVIPRPEPHTISVVGKAMCIAGEGTDANDTAGDALEAVTPSGSYGGTLSFEPVTDGLSYDAPFLLSILPSETADVVLTEEAKIAIARIKDLAERIGKPAEGTVTLSQILANDVGQNTFGTLITLLDGGTVLVTTAVGESYGEIYFGNTTCTDSTPPCQELTMELVNVGGDSSLVLTEEMLATLEQLLNGETETLPGDFQWSSIATGTLTRETGQGDG